MADLSDSIQYIKGVGPALMADFARLGIHTVRDLLFTFPRKISDRSNMVTVSEAFNMLGTEVALRAVGTASSSRRRGRKTFQTVMFEDETGVVEGFWFNSPWVVGKFEDKEVLLFGKADYRDGHLQITHPKVEIVEDSDDASEVEGDALSVGRMVPVYPLTGRLKQGTWLKAMKYAIDKYGNMIDDFYPESFIKKRNIMRLADAVRNMHFPETAQMAGIAKQRLVYDECLVMQLGILYRRHCEVDVVQGRVFKFNDKIKKRIRALLPFELTKGQKRSVEEIVGDMQKPFPMHRLLQGDVGSGKTVVAFYASLVAVANGAQVAVMAPTELLARQHEATFSKFLENSPRSRVRVGLLVGSMKQSEKKVVCASLLSGAIDIIIGTHAAIQDTVNFHDLGFVIIDEQHKFGVNQRAKLKDKGNSPDVLVMTATPIPRSLALTIYGDLDVSTIDGMPPGRKTVKTILPESGGGEEQVWDFLRKKFHEGRQAYIVCPLVEESEELDLKSATELYEQLKVGEFASFRVGLIHGKMKRDEQVEVMNRFRNGEIDALVSTVVIEVGVDVPNATILTVLHAERFGLAQLHQLRGRVTRGVHQGYCILVSGSRNQISRERLGILVKHSDGFRISEEDLRIRGEGEFLGTRQHGHALKLASIVDDFEVLKLARDDARKILANDPELKNEAHIRIRNELFRTLGRRQGIAGSG
jgi:ATP-dependent DNA helicase RecG